VKYGYFLDEPDPSEVTSLGDLGICGAGGTVNSDSVPDSVGAMFIRSLHEREK
jgi:hypothetical protein